VEFSPAPAQRRADPFVLPDFSGNAQMTAS